MRPVLGRQVGESSDNQDVGIFFRNPRSYASLSMDEKQGNTIKVCYGVSP